jgi:hypothetical protein
MQRNPTPTARRVITTAGLTGAALTVSAAAALPSLAAHDHGNNPTSGHNPQGNNGTVFIHDLAGDRSPHNVPHVGCVFYADFFGFDKGQQVTVTFAGQAPTGKGQALGGTWGPGVISSDDAGGAGNDFDAELRFTADELGVAALGAPAHQGYHVKMTVLTGEPGGKKSKVFWLQPCARSAPTTGTAAVTAPKTGSNNVSPTVLGNTSTTTLTNATVAGGHPSSASSPRTLTGSAARVLGEHFTRAAPGVLANRVSSASSLPFTGVEITAMALAGAAAAAGGVLMTVAARRRRATAGP